MTRRKKKTQEQHDRERDDLKIIKLAKNLIKLKNLPLISLIPNPYFNIWVQKVAVGYANDLSEFVAAFDNKIDTYLANRYKRALQNQDTLADFLRNCAEIRKFLQLALHNESFIYKMHREFSSWDPAVFFKNKYEIALISSPIKNLLFSKYFEPEIYQAWIKDSGQKYLNIIIDFALNLYKILYEIDVVMAVEFSAYIKLQSAALNKITLTSEDDKFFLDSMTNLDKKLYDLFSEKKDVVYRVADYVHHHPQLLAANNSLLNFTADSHKARLFTQTSRLQSQLQVLHKANKRLEAQLQNLYEHNKMLKAQSINQQNKISIYTNQSTLFAEMINERQGKFTDVEIISKVSVR